MTYSANMQEVEQKASRRGLNERICHALESHHGRSAKVDIVEDRIGQATETHLEIAPSGIDLKTLIETSENGGGDGGSRDARAASQSLALDTTLVGADGDMPVGKDLCEIHIHSIGLKTFGETDFGGDVHNVDSIEIVDKLDIVRDACIKTESPIRNAFDRIY